MAQIVPPRVRASTNRLLANLVRAIGAGAAEVHDAPARAHAYFGLIVLSPPLLSSPAGIADAHFGLLLPHAEARHATHQPDEIEPLVVLSEPLVGVPAHPFGLVGEVIAPPGLGIEPALDPIGTLIKAVRALKELALVPQP